MAQQFRHILNSNEEDTVGNIWKYFEKLDEILYASDMDTYEMVYANRKACRMLGIGSLEEIQGEKCYQVLHHRTSPCPFCTNYKLKPLEYFEWTHYNDNLGKYFALKDTMLFMDDRRVRVELALDLSVNTQQKNTIQEYENNEQLLNEALQLALGCNDEEEDPIQIFLAFLGEKLECERMYIFEGEDGGPVDNTYEWCAPDVTPEIQNLQQVPYEVVSLWYRMFHEGKNVVIYDLEEIREHDPEMYRTLKPQGIRSLVVSPIVYKDTILGFYGVDIPPSHSLSHISFLLDIIGHFIVCMIQRRGLVRRLESMSYHDQLTGALNRHALTRTLERLRNKNIRVGLIYCDLMGLKQINDTRGHDEGDTLIQEAYQFLQTRSKDSPVFRLGGDEFMVLCENMERRQFDEILHAISRQETYDKVKMAVGYAWREGTDIDFSEMLLKADEDMYRDKSVRRQSILNAISGDMEEWRKIAEKPIRDRPS